MKNNLETWLPKLVIAPAFVLGFAFIYGFMLWNGVLSVTGSRMLPNYDEFVGLAQYEQLFNMDRWWVALRNLGIFSTLYVGGSMLIGMALAIFLVQYLSRPGDLVVDPFGGSLTTAKACEMLGRLWMASEIMAEYVHVGGLKFGD